MNLDFVSIEASPSKRSVDIYPEFIIKKSKDLMIRGKSFYAIWDEEAGFWSKNEDDVQRMIDQEIREYAKLYVTDLHKNLKLLGKFSSNKWLEWQKYCKSLPDNYHELDERIIFSNSKITKRDYVTRTLPYPLVSEPTPAYDEIMETLYDPSEREKLEWAIGAIISGDSKHIQKFIVLYGGPGTGKSTVLNIIQAMFPGYYSVFESKALSSSNNAFALEAFRDNPLIAIQHDGDLSRIEDNTKLNSIVSHEMMVVNEKFKATYSSRFNSFLFMGTNKPVKITDAKSGILRRLIDVTPSGRKIPRRRYEELMRQIQFELGGIASNCLDVYNKLGYSHYDDYIPVSMMGATNDFFNFVEDNYDFFADADETTLTVSWKRYKEYCEEANVGFPFSMRVFKSELKSYFREFYDRLGDRRSVYRGFRKEKFEYKPIDTNESEEDTEIPSWLHMDYQESEFDYICKDCQAQLANENETPKYSWDRVRTTLKEINTHELHYVRVPEFHIVADFDFKKEDGTKDTERNLREAGKWPQTYAELSKGGGVHLHYIYNGDPNELSRVFGDNIEIKVFTGKSSLRRKLTKCNDNPIATISSGLPLKDRKNKMVTSETIKSEKALRNLIERNLRKEIHSATKPSIDFIKKILDDAYESGMRYDVSDMMPAVQYFAMGSTHQADYCMKMLSKMKFKSDEPSDNRENYTDEMPIVFYDVEVFPNLFVIVWKKQGKGQKKNYMINPKPEEVEALFVYKLVGFNNRRYDNHILYAASMGYSNEQLFNLSQRIISGDRDAFFGEAYNLSYTDVYDFLSASNKMSLKKWEIKLGIHHMELGLPWDKPVPEKLWKKVAEYCGNDVDATEAVFDHNGEDWMAREVLAEWAGMTVNDTTNSLTTKLIVGDDKSPQDKFIYTDLSTIYPGYRFDINGIDPSEYKEGAKIVSGLSIYKGEDPGEGGKVFARPGIWYDVGLLDIASMHPHSIIRLKVFGEEYTLRFEQIVDARVAIKHGDYEFAKQILPERLHKYLNDKKKAKKLANAMKTAINSAYGLTSAKFPNKLKDPRNVDNIVAKYGALFMIDLKEAVEKEGYTVVHIKTDSIKIANMDDSIKEFVMDFGKKYGFTFEHEATYERMCLVNEAVYIAKYDKPHIDENGEEVWWTATGTQFQIPYVFKTLFSKKPIEFNDMVETKSATTALYLDYNEGLREGHDYRFVGKVGGFCPVVDGVGGGILLRDSGKNDGKFSAVVGTKKPGKEGGAYRWMEAEMVKNLGYEDRIDRGYYRRLCDAAIDEIRKYGDFYDFVEGGRLNAPGLDDEVPFDEFPMNPPKVA